jgi:hypothetical protein
MKIRDIALARSGDKGNRATLSVIASTRRTTRCWSAR